MNVASRELTISERLGIVTVIDEEDWDYVTRWRWTFKRSRASYGRSLYACRNTTMDGIRVKIMLHNVILERSGKKRPSPLHTGHHKNRKSLDNTRENLEWATKKKQRRERGDG